MLNIFSKSKVQPSQPSGSYLINHKQAGVVINQDTALNYSAVYSCVKVISETIAQLPWSVFQNVSGGTTDKNVTHPVYRLIHTRPNPEMTSFSFKETMMAWALLWGNGYAEIEKDVSGRPIALWPISPNRVKPTRDDQGNLIYEVRNGVSAPVIIKSDEMFHLHGLGFDGLVGYDIVTLASRSIGLGVASQEFGASFFGNGAIPGGIITNEIGKELSDKGIKSLLAKFNRKLRGPVNAHKVEYIDAGMKYQQIGVAPEAAQFLETRKFQVNEIARWFRVPPHKIADLEKATFSNIEEQNIQFVTDTIQPWVTRIEQEADYKLFSSSKFYTKFNLNSLLRGDAESRAAFYRSMFDMGSLSPNEIRSFEDLNPIDGGEKYFVQLNLTTLENAGEQPETVESDDNTDAAFNAIFTEVINRIDRRKQNKLDTVSHKTGEDLEKWTAKFEEDHKQYIIDSLTTPISAYAAVINPKANVSVVNEYINQLSDNLKASDVIKDIKDLLCSK